MAAYRPVDATTKSDKWSRNKVGGPCADRDQGDIGAGSNLWNKEAAGNAIASDEGSSLGPDLTRVGRQRSIAYLTASLLKPDAM